MSEIEGQKPTGSLEDALIPWPYGHQDHLPAPDAWPVARVPEDPRNYEYCHAAASLRNLQAAQAAGLYTPGSFERWKAKHGEIFDRYNAAPTSDTDQEAGTEDSE